jgi:hypothetical protein
MALGGMALGGAALDDMALGFMVLGLMALGFMASGLLLLGTDLHLLAMELAQHDSRRYPWAASIHFWFGSRAQTIIPHYKKYSVVTSLPCCCCCCSR